MFKKTLVATFSVYVILISGVMASVARTTCQEYANKCKEEIYTWADPKECGPLKKKNFLASFGKMVSSGGINEIAKQFDTCCKQTGTWWNARSSSALCYCKDSAEILRSGGFCSGKVEYF